jgi:hypothetical protein
VAVVTPQPRAFSSVGNAFMVNPDFGGVRPTVFICGNDPGAKAEVRAILDRFGWETEDMGRVEAARASPLCTLWSIPGLLRGEWGMLSYCFQLASWRKTRWSSARVGMVLCKRAAVAMGTG